MRNFRRIVAVWLLTLFSIVYAQNGNSSNLIHVSGQGSHMIQKDSVDIRVAVETRGDSAMQAQVLTANSVERLLQNLRQLNVTNIQTESVSLQPIYNYTESPIRILGFESTNVILYTVDPTLAGQTLDIAVQSGANRIDSVSVGTSKTKRDEAYEQALANACSNAKDKASLVAQNLGVCIVSPVIVNIEPNEHPTPTIMYEMMQVDVSATQSSLPESTIVPGEMDVMASVQISYSFSSC